MPEELPLLVQAQARALLPALERTFRAPTELRGIDELRAAGVSERRIAGLYPFDYTYPQQIEELLDRQRDSWLSRTVWELNMHGAVWNLPQEVRFEMKDEVPDLIMGDDGPTYVVDHNQLDYLIGLPRVLGRMDRAVSVPNVWMAAFAPAAFSEEWMAAQRKLAEIERALPHIERRLHHPTAAERMIHRIGYGSGKLVPAWHALRSKS